MNIEKHSFITEYLRHNSPYTAYCLAYKPEDASQYESIMTAAQQLMDAPEVGGVIRSVLEGVRHDVEQEIRAQQKTQLLTMQCKRELLARIARGELTAVQHYKGKDCNHCTQMVLPTINQMLKAIDLDSKLAGHYSVDKRHHPEPSRQVTVDNKMENNGQEHNNLSLPFRGIGGNPQQNATNNTHCSPPYEGGENYEQRTAVCNSGEVNSQRTENTPESQQNATIHLSPAGGGVRRTGVDYSQRTENTPESQQNATNKQSPLSGRGLGKA